MQRGLGRQSGRPALGRLIVMRILNPGRRQELAAVESNLREGNFIVIFSMRLEELIVAANSGSTP